MSKVDTRVKRVVSRRFEIRGKTKNRKNAPAKQKKKLVSLGKQCT